MCTLPHNRWIVSRSGVILTLQLFSRMTSTLLGEGYVPIIVVRRCKALLQIRGSPTEHYLSWRVVFAKGRPNYNLCGQLHQSSPPASNVVMRGFSRSNVRRVKPLFNGYFATHRRFGATIRASSGFNIISFCRAPSSG